MECGICDVRKAIKSDKCFVIEIGRFAELAPIPSLIELRAGYEIGEGGEPFKRFVFEFAQNIHIATMEDDSVIGQLVYE